MSKHFGSLSRRQFSLCLAGAPFAFPLNAGAARGLPWNTPAKVEKVFLAGEKIHWPKPDLDLQREVSEINQRLAEVQRKHSHEVVFTGGELLRNTAQVARWAKRLDETDGLLLIPLTAPTGPLRQVVEAAKRPTLYFSRLYAGHGWSQIPGLRSQGYAIDEVATSSYGDLDPYMPIFKTVHHLRKSKLLVVTDRPDARRKLADGYSSKFGLQTKFFKLSDMRRVFRSGDQREAKRLARQITSEALRVIEPSPKEIEDAARFYIGIQKLLEKESANAITIDCFGAIDDRGKMSKLPAYPCISWSRLNDQGMYGVCEADVNSTLTQMLLTSCTRMPGFVSDPVFDVSRNEVIHAHCVAATRMKGIDGPASPYYVRSHLETAEGATLQVLMPAGETITCAKFTGPDRLLVFTAKVTSHLRSDRGCRTQIRTVVTDARKLLDNYSGGLHRVIFYGDHVPTIDRMGKMMGFEVVHEI